MPIYEFQCSACGEHFEELCGFGTLPACPACGAAETQRLISRVSEIPRIVQSSGTRRQSDNRRRVEREKRQERQQRREG